MKFFSALFFLLFVQVVSGGEKPNFQSREAQVPSGVASSLSVVAYYPIWSYCDMPPQQLDYRAFSHLVLFGGASSGITPNVGTSPYFPPATPGNNSFSITFTGTPGWCANPVSGKNHVQIMRDSCTANGVKMLLDLGGEYGSPASAFASLIADTTKFDTYINAVDSICRRNIYGVQFDGVTIDWEFPTRGATGRANYTLFLNKLRAKLNTWAPNKGLLGMAVPTWYWWDTQHTDPLIDLSTLNNDVDLVDLMEYGMENTSRISHYSPIYPNPAVSQETWNLRGIHEWAGAGVLKSKIVTLIPFESIKMTASASPVTIGASGGSASWIGLRDIPSGVTTHWDSISQVNWAESGTSFYSYENAASLSAKVQYAEANGIGGVGVWELWRGWLPNAAAGQHDPLLQALKAAVGGFVPPPPVKDTINPVVTLTSPLNGDTVSGTVTVTVTASDNVGVASVQLLVNGVVTATDNTAPYSFSWNTSGLNGVQTLAAKAADAAGNTTTTPSVSVFAITDNVKPTVGIIAPVNGDTVSSTVIITATAADNRSVANVQFLVNGVVVAVDISSPYTYVWNTLGLSGTQTLTAKATDPSGNSSTSSPISVTVVAPPGVPSNWIYRDTLVSPWRDTSWGALNQYNSTEQVYAGLYALKTVQSAWAAFSARSGPVGSPVHVTPQQYSQLQFAVYNTCPGLILNVYCYNDHGDIFPNILQSNVPVNQWTIISVPMSQLDPNDYVIDRICVQNYTRFSALYYLDNILLVTAVPPPTPPAPISPPSGLTVQTSPVNLSWSASTNAMTYVLQVAIDSLFTLLIYNDSTLTTTSRQLASLTSYTNYYWRVAGLNLSGQSAWSPTSMFRYVAYTHWDMISLPIQATDPRSHSVFPTAISEAFKYTSSGYVIIDTLFPGSGYWMKFGSDETMVAPGNPILVDTINIISGWNLIGSISVPIDVRTLASIPPGVTISSVFSYNPSYTIADSIRPGHGYWLRSTASGQLILAAPSQHIVAGRVAIEETSELPPAPPEEGASTPPLPVAYALEQNFPNPFNPSTDIIFAVPNESFVTLKVYDLLGREVASLVHDRRPAGTYREKFVTNGLASGIYLYRLSAGSFVQVKKMLLLK